MISQCIRAFAFAIQSVKPINPKLSNAKRFLNQPLRPLRPTTARGSGQSTSSLKNFGKSVVETKE
jgi:hypothetical protein